MMIKNKNTRFFLLILGLIVMAEVLSLTGYTIPFVTNIAALIVVVLAAYLTFKKPAYGFLIILSELIIASQGYLLWLGEAGNRLSLRIALWIVVMAIWLVKEIFIVIRQKKIPPYWFNFSYYFPFALLLIAIVSALINGMVNSNDISLIFIEAKRWLYLITIIPVVIVLRDQDSRQKFPLVISASIVWISIKTLLLLYIFSHGLEISEFIYAWTRANLLGEITTLANGFSRVFLQSQVFAIPASIFSVSIFLRYLKEDAWRLSKRTVVYGLASVLFFSVIIISLSRSFWFGIAVALLVILLTILAVYRQNIKQWFFSITYIIGIGLATIILLFVVLQFPVPKPLFSFNTNLLSDRANANDAAADSRWALLPVMTQAIMKEPIFAYGLGKTLTYTSSDPRITRSSVDGLYTTNAFEWGWLDIWIKLGILGIIAYLWLLLKILKKAISRLKINPHQSLAIIGSLFAILSLNIFTPYLNHPLGFAYLAIIILAGDGLD